MGFVLLYLKFDDPNSAFTHTLNNLRYYINCGIVILICSAVILVKPNPNKEETGGIIEREMPLDASNIMIYNPISKKADKVGFKFLENGKKVRVYKSNKEVIDI